MSPTPDLSRPFDIAVVGAGPAGLAFAAAMKQALGRRLRLVIVDPRPEARDGKLRAVALAEGSKNLIERIGAWGALEPKAQAIHEMAIFDGRARDAVRMEQLRFRERWRSPARPHGVQRRPRRRVDPGVRGSRRRILARGGQRVRAGSDYRGAGVDRRASTESAAHRRRRRRAVEAARARRDHDRRARYRADRHRGDHCPRARPRGPRRTALPPWRPVRHPAYARPLLQPRVERKPRGRRDDAGARRRRFFAPARAALHPQTGRVEARFARRSPPPRVPHRAKIRRGAAGADRRRRACRAPARRARAQPRLARRRRAR